jgi:hypothetical protein
MPCSCVNRPKARKTVGMIRKIWSNEEKTAIVPKIIKGKELAAAMRTADRRVECR